MSQVDPSTKQTPTVEEASNAIDSGASPSNNDVDAEVNPNGPVRNDWQLWPPSPKVQILMIAAVFGVINLILIAIWAVVMVYRFQ
jgi:hypothetical protein